MLLSNSKTDNSIKIILTGLAQYIITFVSGFVTRTIFIKTLGTEYLGINGLFTNVLSLISLAELGIGSAITYYMYKPLAENNIDELKAIMNFYKYCYRIIAMVIFCIGLSIMPFLSNIVKIDPALNINIYGIYLLFLLNTVVSYMFLSYRSTIIYASQKGYLLNTINCIYMMIFSMIDISILLIFKNFILTLIIRILLEILNNVVISIKAGRIFPFINEKSNNKLLKEQIRAIVTNVYSIFVFRMSVKLFEATDNIIISAFIGTIYVGYNSNYIILISSALGVINIIRNAFVSSVGNINASKDKEIQYSIFRNLDFFNFWISSFCAVCFFQLLNPFITLWIGKEYLFSLAAVGAIVTNFLIVSLLHIVFMFRETMGLFKYGKYGQLGGGLINILLSIILAKYYGVFGVFLATCISRVLTTIFPFPKIVYKYGFNKSYREYIVRYFNYVVLTIISCFLVWICSSIFKELSWVTFMGQVLICILVPNGLYIILFRKTKEYLWIKNKLITVCLGFKGKVFKKEVWDIS